MRYIGKQPAKCLRHWLGGITNALVFGALFMVLPATGVLYYGDWLSDETSLAAVLGLLGCAAAFTFFATHFFEAIEHASICRIVPYFERTVAVWPDSTPSAFETGVHLARRCRWLDELAVREGVPPLSTYGFRDDRDGQRLVWHAAADGVRTAERLISVVQKGTTQGDVLNDLERLHRYLLKAQAKGIRFCLVVRGGLDRMISPMEMENRKGRFW
jgi:hypothetical protein